MSMRRILLILAGVITSVLAVVRVPEQDVTLVVEAEDYAAIAEPMRIVANTAGASGEAYIELPLGSGQGWRGEGSGNVAYRLDLARAGDYRIWARTRWRDGCTNAFFLSANDGPRVVLGNDAVFGEWHWVKGQTLPLEKGVNYLTFANHSDGTALDKLIVTNNPLYLPRGLGEDITRFFDGFAGCDANNTGSWEFPSGDWRVVRGMDQGAGINDCLAQWSSAGGLALGGFHVWHDYDVSLKVMLSGPGTVAIVFYRPDDQRECRLVWDASGDDYSVLRFEQVSQGKPEVLGEARTVPCCYDSWCQLGFRDTAGKLTCALDTRPILSVDYSGERSGQIGLLTPGTGGVYFDNVEVLFHDTAGSVSTHGKRDPCSGWCGRTYRRWREFATGSNKDRGG